MANQANQKSLVSKLVDAMSVISGIDKKGRNETQNYKYVRAADVAITVRKELFKRGILLISDEKEVTERTFQTLKGSLMTFVRLKVEYTLRDSESGETIVACGYGDAMDTGDKAIYKAKTGALKYFLRSIGIIPDEHGDPEFDESVDEHTDTRVYGENGNGSGGKKRARVAEYQVRAFNASCHETGKTAKQIADYLRVRFSASSVGELTKDDFTDAIKWANATESLSTTLQASVEATKRPVAGTEPRYEAVAQGD